MFHVKHWPHRRGNAAALLLALALGACSSPEDIAAATGTTTTTTTTTTASATATGTASATAAAVNLEDNAEKDGGRREFSYKWPAQVSAIPALSTRLTAERNKLLAEQKSDWETALADFKGEDCVSCKTLSLSKEWKVVADLPRFLSLSADIYAYTGGAHGNSGFDALVWDREAGKALDPKAMFTSEAALQDALGEAWCKALKVERKKRLGADYRDDGFFACPPVSDLALLPGSSNGQTFDRIGLLAAPYVAGAYAEGSYEVTLPVDAALLTAVKPAFKPAFGTGK
jgi:hypothetical protein